MNIPPGYRRLERGETILATDRYTGDGTGDDTLISDSNIKDWIGRAIRDCTDRYTEPSYGAVWQILRRISPWVFVGEALPDEEGYYFVKNPNLPGDSGRGYFYKKAGAFNLTNVTHWMKIPELPTPIAPPIYIQEGPYQREIIFNKDGSIKAGCADISASQMDAIVKRWEEVKK